MSFLSRLLKGRRAESVHRPKVDQHSTYTNCQMSRVIMEGKLSVHEPWRKHRKKPKSVIAYLYTNDSSPFIVWYAEKARKQARGCIDTNSCEITPLDEYSFQITTKANGGGVYKFHADRWENREEWLYNIREQFRKKPVLPEFQKNLNGSPGCSETPKSVTNSHSRARRYGHRRTLSAETPSPKLDECSVLLQRSRSQPHLQNKARLLKRRPQLAEVKPPVTTTTVQRISVDTFVRSPEI
ncbi:uncharacterized protein LOC144452161 [Glandiceps talaboti]